MNQKFRQFLEASEIRVDPFTIGTKIQAYFRSILCIHDILTAFLLIFFVSAKKLPVKPRLLLIIESFLKIEKKCYFKF